MRLRFIPLLACLFTLLHIPAQYSLTEEVVAEDIGVLIGALGVTDLTGYSCTQLYVNMINDDDFMSSVSGDALNPTYVETTTNFYHSVLGGVTPNGINALLFPVYPDLVYDSWVTIGLSGAPNAAVGEAAVSTVQSGTNPWATNFDPGGGLPGGNISIDDAIGGAWYALNGDANGVAGADLQVLIGQFTTTGELSGQVYCQIFINGDGANEYRETFYIGAPPAIDGCPDPAACNYDEAATVDDGSCTYPSADNLDCDGNCLNDADMDGVCDEDEIAGCTEAEACNYDMAATDDDGSCTYPAADNLDCDGNCLNDADMDGVCDEDEIAGCTDTEAANYDADATDDDGSCTFGCAPEWGMPITLPSVATVLALITVDGENAAMEDQVGAFVNGELRGTGDIIDYEGATYVSMTVYLAGGEEMIDFVLFNEDECATCTMDAELTVTGFGEYGSFDAPLMFDANCSATTLEVSLMEGWNYVSTNLILEDYGISTLFEDALDGALLKVLGDDNFALGQSYTPGIPSVFNSLQMHTDGAGYVIKVNADAIWTSAGSPLEAASTPLDLNEGWNIVGYVPQIAMGVEEALASIDGVVGTVIDGQNGTVWNPANPNEFNSLLDLDPGRSYWVRMLEAATLIYPEGTTVDGGGMVLADTKSDGEAAENMTGWSVERAPGAAALAAEILVNGLPVDGEAYIGAFVDNACVAVRPVINAVQTTAAQMAVMLNGPSEVQFKLWLDGVVFDAENVLTMEGGDEFGQGGAALPVIHFTSATNGMAMAQWVSGLDIHPVPAQNEAWLTLNLMQAEQLRIAVLDARGGEVAVIHDGMLAAGEHRLMLAVQGWAAGTYFLRGTGKSGTFHDRFIVR